MNKVPFFRPTITAAEIDEVVDTLRSGWLTTGPKVQRFETNFAQAVQAKHAISVNSCTAALHLALEALGLKPGHAVLVPTMTFAATAEVVRYQGAVPILVDCDPNTLNIDLEDAARKIEQLRNGKLPASIPRDTLVVGIIPVHVGGLMLDCAALKKFAHENGLWIIEDAAHAFPAAWRTSKTEPWQKCGQGTAEVSCFSFYANKTITTGEGGMAVTDNATLASRMRMMSLHGLTRDAWSRYSEGGSWDYKIGAPGFKYNLTDIAAAIGIHQLARAEQMRSEREAIAKLYLQELRSVTEIELPPDPPDRIHSWHLFPIKLRLRNLSLDRNAFIETLKQAGIGCSVHWRPLHLHPYYRETFGWRAEDLPIASAVWKRLISLPIFPGMLDREGAGVIKTIKRVCLRSARSVASPAQIVKSASDFLKHE
ncbi:MAG TPA: DegT/DnrJ/EryC1/StrS aminotransferase family protein [Pyrinomonadaceae bacterium]|nr:DegT/DnrJ/EryC1/StrS aminotransferase family protein [Pyrinomonadaceae bacterium]